MADLTGVTKGRVFLESIDSCLLTNYKQSMLIKRLLILKFLIVSSYITKICVAWHTPDFDILQLKKFLNLTVLVLKRITATCYWYNHTLQIPYVLMLMQFRCCCRKIVQVLNFIFKIEKTSTENNKNGLDVFFNILPAVLRCWCIH